MFCSSDKYTEGVMQKSVEEFSDNEAPHYKKCDNDHPACRLVTTLTELSQLTRSGGINKTGIVVDK
jgi:hypothetical protein